MLSLTGLSLKLQLTSLIKGPFHFLTLQELNNI